MVAQELLLNLPKAMKGIVKENKDKDTEDTFFKYQLYENITNFMESIARRNDTHNRNEEANRTFRKFSL